MASGFVLARLVALVGVVLLALGAPLAGAQESRTVTIALAADPVTLDPNATRDTTSNMNYGNLFEGLYDLDAKGQPQPSLATSYRLVDPLTWEFKLRSGVKFHNGEPLDAQAVKFTYDRTMDRNFRTGWRTFIEPVERVDVVDPMTVRIVTKRPFPTLLNQLSYLPIVPPRYVQEKGAAVFAKSPVGTGPFRFVEWVPGTRLVVEAFPGYWRGAPKVQRVVIRPIPELATRIAELETGGVDIVMQLPPDQAQRLRSHPRLQIIGLPSTQVMILQVNTKSGHEKLKDLRVRQAISLAINRSAVVNQLLLGEANLINSPLSAEYLGYDRSLPVPEHNPARARQLLQEAGAAGLELRFSTPSGRYVQDTQIAEIVASQLRAVGLAVKVEPLEIAQYVQRLQNRTIGDLVYIGVGSEDRDAGTTLKVYLSSESVWSQYTNPELDRQIAAAVVIMDREQRRAAYEKAVAYAVQDAAGIWLWDAKYLFGINKRLRVTPHSGDWHPIVAHEIDFAQ
jgi:peptide/nickel transport system substrate-binding protein